MFTRIRKAHAVLRNWSFEFRQNKFIRQLKKQIKIRGYLKNGWDEENAQAVSEDTLKLIEDFFLSLNFICPSTKDFAAGNDGSLGIHWKNSLGKLYLDFCQNNIIRFYYDVPSFATEENVIQFPNETLASFRLKLTMQQLFSVSN